MIHTVRLSIMNKSLAAALAKVLATLEPPAVAQRVFLTGPIEQACGQPAVAPHNTVSSVTSTSSDLIGCRIVDAIAIADAGAYNATMSVEFARGERR